MTSGTKRLNVGCGLSVARGWLNYDASPTLWLQRLPLVGPVARSFVPPRFPREVVYADLVAGLPEPSGAADCVYSSHVLEHLALEDLHKALREVLRVLRPGGIFRGVLPDLEGQARSYLEDPRDDACSRFMESSGLGQSRRPRSALDLARALLGHSRHQWMWDLKGLRAALIGSGFVNVRAAEYGDSSDPCFAAVEDPVRWRGCLGFECSKP